MPSAIETLVKILKLEREQGCKNNVVIGGLAAYGSNWRGQAASQARRPEHMMLVDEITDLLNRYDQLETKDERDSTIRYILDRVTGRQPAPGSFWIGRRSSRSGRFSRGGRGGRASCAGAFPSRGGRSPP
jgi:hypothetical protein